MTPRVETPLHSIRQSAGEIDSAAVKLTELGHCTHIVLRGDRDNVGFSEGVSRVLGMDLPAVGCTEDSKQSTLYWLGPDEWLAVLRDDVMTDPVAELRRETTGHVSFVDVSSGQSLLNL